MIQKFTQKKIMARLLKSPLANFLLSFQCLLVLFMSSTNRSSAQTYCSPTSNTNGGIYYIASVVTTGGSTNISNTGTTASTNGYGNYTAMVVTAMQSASFTLTANSDALFTYKWAVWADWNHDGDFDDTGETIYTFLSSTGVSTITTPVAIPAAAIAGNTRLRVRVLRDWATDPLTPCVNDIYGETEDYTINVVASSCSGTPAAGTTNAAATTVPCNTTTTLSLNGNTSGTGITYQWQYNSTGTWVNFGTNAATQTTPAITQNTQFRCKLTCTNTGGGNSNSTPVTVSVTGIAVNIGNDTTICPGIAYTLNAGNLGTTYLWSTGATTQTITTNAAGTYYVTVSLPTGCTGSDTINIIPGVTPVNNLPPTTNLCSGESATLNAGNTGSTFLWTPGNATTQTINVTSGGTYNVKVKSVNGCIINSNTNVIMRPLPVVALGNDTSICPGATITLDAGNPGNNYSWNTGAVTQVIPVSDSGLYTVIVTTPYSCVDTDARHIAHLPAPRVEGFNFIPLFYENLGKVLFSPLNPTNVNSFEWNFGDGSPVNTQVNPSHIYASGGHYEVSLKVFNGCGDFTISLPINVDIVTGMVNLDKDIADVNLYPNPSRDYITIDNRSAGIKMEKITVFNILGGVVYTQEANSASKHQLSVSHLSAGMYTMRILTNEGFVVRKFEVVK